MRPAVDEVNFWAIWLEAALYGELCGATVRCRKGSRFLMVVVRRTGVNLAVFVACVSILIGRSVRGARPIATMILVTVMMMLNTAHTVSSWMSSPDCNGL